MSHETLTGRPIQEVPAYRNLFQLETNSVCMRKVLGLRAIKAATALPCR